MTSPSVSLGSRWSLLFFFCLFFCCSLLLPCALLRPPVRPLPDCSGSCSGAAHQILPGRDRPTGHLAPAAANSWPLLPITCSCSDPRILAHSPIPSQDASRSLIPRFLPRSPTQGSSQGSSQASFCPESKVGPSESLHHDGLPPWSGGERAVAPGRRLTASLTSDDSSSHPLACCAVACPFPPSLPQFPRPLLCARKPTRPGHNTCHSDNYALGELEWEPVVLSLGPVGAGQAMQRTCFIHRTAEHSSCVSYPAHGCPCLSRLLLPPRLKSLQELLPRRSSRLMLSRSPAFCLRYACLPEIWIVPSSSLMSGLSSPASGIAAAGQLCQTELGHRRIAAWCTVCGHHRIPHQPILSPARPQIEQLGGGRPVGWLIHIR